MGFTIIVLRIIMEGEAEKNDKIDTNDSGHDNSINMNDHGDVVQGDGVNIEIHENETHDEHVDTQHKKTNDGMEQALLSLNNAGNNVNTVLNTGYRGTNHVDIARYKILDKLRINCVNLAAYHNNRYHLYKNLLFTCFRVPLIVLSGLNSLFSVGLQTYVSQTKVSLINAVISLFCGILTSVELLLNLQKRMEVEMECGKEYYKLSVELFTELSKAPCDRGEKGDLGKFLTEKHNVYQTLHARGNAININERGFVDRFELYLETEIEINSTDDNDVNSSRKRRNGSFRQGTLCPEFVANTISSFFDMLLYCCISRESNANKRSRDVELEIGDKRIVQKKSSGAYNFIV